MGKSALITGGSRGIGRCIALELARAGYDIQIFYSGNDQAADEAVALVSELGVRCLAFKCDVSDFDQVQAAYEQASKELGAPYALVNNAGITRDALAMRMKPEDFTSVIDVNLVGAFHVIRAALPDFVRRRSGRIINITSVSGLMGNAGQANYSAAKAGLVGLTKSIAREVASRGITVNAIAPGFIETDMTDAMDQDVLSAAIESLPMKRIGKPEDIAALAAFLTSDGASYITGAVIKVDGGLYI